jgi:hypothetical protein
VIYLCTSQDDLARHKDEKHDLGFDHAINETREQLVWLTHQQRNFEKT